MATADRSADHVFRRAVGLQDDKFVYFPIPKAGCTSYLWLCAERAGYPDGHFQRSVAGEMTRAMTVHDIGRWRRPHRWSDWPASLRDQAERSGDWLLATTVRHPTTRVWSAWQSKLLLQEPWFVKRFGDRPWFPHQVRDRAGVAAAFRAFVAALEDEPGLAAADKHWVPQTEILASAPGRLHVGRFESMAESNALIFDHLGLPPETRLRRENASILSFAPELLDAATADRINRLYADDLAAYGYDPAEAGPDGTPWSDAVDHALRLVGMVVDRHQRIADLRRLAGRRNRLLGGNRPIPAGRRSLRRPRSASS